MVWDDVFFNLYIVLPVLLSLHHRQEKIFCRLQYVLLLNLQVTDFVLVLRIWWNQLLTISWNQLILLRRDLNWFSQYHETNLFYWEGIWTGTHNIRKLTYPTEKSWKMTRTAFHKYDANNLLCNTTESIWFSQYGEVKHVLVRGNLNWFSQYGEINMF